VKKTLVYLVAWILIVNIFAILAVNRLNLKGDTVNSTLAPSEQNHVVFSWMPFSLRTNWDSNWYVDISQNGYHLESNGRHATAAFFPLYPLLMRAFAPLVGGVHVLSGWLLNIFFLAGVVAALYRLVKEFHPSLEPTAPIFYLLIFPAAFFLNAVYAECLFLLLSLLTFYYALKNRFTLAGVFGLLASLTRITGVLLLVPIAWEYFKRHPIKKRPDPSVLKPLLIPLGTVLFFLYHYYKFGDFLLFFKVESAWGRAFQFNANHFLLLNHPSVVNLILDSLYALFTLIMIYIAFKRGWVAYGLYMLSTVAVALSTGTLMSIGRFVLVLFPIYIVLASIKGRNFERIYVTASVLLFALNIILFVNRYWAG
jgi:Gpi18-like mannosyltransferase